MPSFWSSVANSERNSRRSVFTPSVSVVSKAALTASLAMATAVADSVAIFSPSFTASATSSAAGTTRATRLARSAASAPIMLPVSTISMALDLPMARVSRWLPPAPGMTPRLISGWPNFAVSAARIRSHIMASSQPPPSAKPATAAMTGFFTRSTVSHGAMKSLMKTAGKVRACISLISAPAAKAFSLPVMTMAATAGSAS